MIESNTKQLLVWDDERVIEKRGPPRKKNRIRGPIDGSTAEEQNEPNKNEEEHEHEQKQKQKGHQSSDISSPLSKNRSLYAIDPIDEISDQIENDNRKGTDKASFHPSKRLKVSETDNQVSIDSDSLGDPKLTPLKSKGEKDSKDFLENSSAQSANARKQVEVEKQKAKSGVKKITHNQTLSISKKAKRTTALKHQEKLIPFDPSSFSSSSSSLSAVEEDIGTGTCKW